MTEVQSICAKLSDFLREEKDKNNPNLELTPREVEILYNLIQ